MPLLESEPLLVARGGADWLGGGIEEAEALNVGGGQQAARPPSHTSPPTQTGLATSSAQPMGGAARGHQPAPPHNPLTAAGAAPTPTKRAPPLATATVKAAPPLHAAIVTP